MKEIREMIAKLNNLDTVSKNFYLRNFIVAKDKNFTIDDEHLLEDTSVLVNVSLKNNYKKTIETLVKHCDELGSPRAYLNLVEALRYDFVLEENSIPLIKVCPKLLEHSFKNDFKATLDSITVYLNSLWDNIDELEYEAYKYEQYILSAMEKNEYVLDDNYNHLQVCLNDVNSVINISYENDPITTVKQLLRFPYSRATRDFLEDTDIVSILKKDDTFVMDTTFYENASGYVSEERLEILINHSLKNDEFATFINGCHEQCPFFLTNMNEKKEDYIVDLLLKNSAKFTRKYNTTLSFTNLIKSYPNVFVKLINKDYKCALKMLGSVKVDRLDKDTLNIIKNELVKHDYVVGYIDNNIYLLDTMFFESLKLDFNKTMAHINDVYMDDFYEEKLNLHGEELKNIISYNLANNDCLNPDAIVKFIKCDNEILMKAMRMNPKKTIENLSKIKDPVDIGFLGVENQKEFEEILVNSKFSLADNKNISLMYLNSAFLLASLKNDYKGTKEAILKRKPILASTKYGPDDYNRILDITRENNDRDLFFTICAKNVYLLDKLMETDLNLGYEAIDKLKSPFPLSKEDSEYIINLIQDLSDDGTIDFKNHPNLAGLLAWGMLKGKTEESYKQELINQGLPVSFLPLSSRDDFKRFLTSRELKLYDKIYFNSKNYEYEKEDEEELLDCLGSQFDCIEDELASLQAKGVTRKDLSLTQLLLFALFMKKDQYNKDLYGYSLNLYEYCNKETTLGVHRGERKQIYMFNGHDSTIAELLKTIVHENNHARQHSDVANCDVWNDVDILAYSKDELLRYILRDLYQLDFYDDNYWETLIEHDAELKAQLEISRILRIDPDSEELNGHIEIESRNRNFLNFGLEKNKYTLTGKRVLDGETMYLDEIFDRIIDKAIVSDVISKSSIKRRYPIIAYEYDLDATPVKRYTIEELISNYSFGDNLDKDIIKAVLRYRCNPLYGDNYLDNINEIERVMNKYNVDDITLSELVEDSRNMCKEKVDEIKGRIASLDKYLKIAENILNSDRRVSKEEFSKLVGK